MLTCCACLQADVGCIAVTRLTACNTHQNGLTFVVLSHLLESCVSNGVYVRGQLSERSALVLLHHMLPIQQREGGKGVHCYQDGASVCVNAIQLISCFQVPQDPGLIEVGQRGHVLHVAVG